MGALHGKSGFRPVHRLRQAEDTPRWSCTRGLGDETERSTCLVGLTGFNPMVRLRRIKSLRAQSQHYRQASKTCRVSLAPGRQGRVGGWPPKSGIRAIRRMLADDLQDQLRKCWSCLSYSPAGGSSDGHFAELLSREAVQMIGRVGTAEAELCPLSDYNRAPLNASASLTASLKQRTCCNPTDGFSSSAEHKSTTE